MQDIPTSKEKAAAWFDVEIYEPAAIFDVENWVEQIAKRAIIGKALEAEDKTSLDLFMPELIDAPLSDFPFRYNNASLDIKRLNYATGAVVPLAIGDLARLHNLNSSFPTAQDEAVDQWSRANEELEALQHFGHLKVDMNARDVDILVSFNQWLTAYRNAPGVPTLDHVYRKEIGAEMTHWHESMVLPYFDLCTWAQWSRVSLTEMDVFELLFPLDSNPSRDKLRTTKKNSKQLLTIANAMMLSIRR